MRIGIIGGLKQALPSLRFVRCKGGRGLSAAAVVGLLVLSACAVLNRGSSQHQAIGAPLAQIAESPPAAQPSQARATEATPPPHLVCITPTERPEPTATAAIAPEIGEFDAERAFGFIGQQLAFGPRVPGSEAHGKTAAWISAQLERAGWLVEEQRFTYQGVELRNLIAHSPSPGGKWILLGAHYDTRPAADQDPVDPQLPVPGANDGGSGVAVLIELANGFPPGSLPCELWMAFFDAEDSGGINGWEWFVGSKYLAASLEGEPQAVVVVDMVGDADLQIYLETNSDRKLADSIWDVAADLGHDAFIPGLKYTILDDHIPFRRRGIPAADIIDFDYPYWHTAQDTLDKVSARSLAQVGETLAAWLRETCR
jgi:glutaminyl-peptide cyclotransferase